MAIKRHSQLTINCESIMISLILISIGMGNLNNALPLNLSEIIVMILAFFQLLEMIYKRKIIISSYSVLMTAYVILITVVLNHNLSGAPLKMLCGMILYSFCFFYYVWKRRNNLNLVIKLLLNISVILSVIGIMQEIGYLLSIKGLYLFDYLGFMNKISTTGSLIRITSLSTEPAHLGYMLVPGLYLALAHLFRMDNEKIIKVWQMIAIFAATLLTFSFLAYLNVLIIVFFLLLSGRASMIKKASSLIILSVIVFIISLSFSGPLQAIESKYNSLFTLDQLNTTNLSSFAVESNFFVALQNAKDHHYLGSGLDTHQDAYFKYISQYYNLSDVVMFLNSGDAASLFIRILSEFGEVGLALFLIFLIKFKIKKRSNGINIQANELALVTIIGYGLRNGFYLDPYFWAAATLYVVSYNEFKKQRQNEKFETSNKVDVSLARIAK